MLVLEKVYNFRAGFGIISRDGKGIIGGMGWIVQNDHLNPDCSSKVKIETTSDSMHAFITIAPAGEMLDIEQVLQVLGSAGVIFGTDEQAVEQAIQHPGSRVAVAHGQPSVPGTDGRIEYLYKQQELKPVLMEDGTVNYYELGYITPIDAGSTLAVRTPPTEGGAGRNVKGDLLPPRPGKNPAFQVGQGVIVTEDQAIAEFDGALTWRNDKMLITRLLTVKGDVDFSVGNLDFAGKLLVTGTVQEGFKVEAEDDIEIRGGIDNAQVVSRQGCIFVQQGIIGRGRAIVKAGRNIEARFIQEAEVEAGESILVNEYIMRCKLTAGDAVLIQGRKGRIMGSNQIFARTRIKASQIQNNNHPLNLRVGGFERPDLYERIKEINGDLELMGTRMRQSSLVIRRLRDRVSEADAVMQLQRILPTYLKMTEDYDRLIKERDSLVSILKNTRGEGMIEINGGLEPGIMLSIKQETVKLKERLNSLNMYFDPDQNRIIFLEKY